MCKSVSRSDSGLSRSTSFKLCSPSAGASPELLPLDRGVGREHAISRPSAHGKASAKARSSSHPKGVARRRAQHVLRRWMMTVLVRSYCIIHVAHMSRARRNPRIGQRLLGAQHRRHFCGGFVDFAHVGRERTTQKDTPGVVRWRPRRPPHSYCQPMPLSTRAQKAGKRLPRAARREIEELLWPGGGSGLFELSSAPLGVCEVPRDSAANGLGRDRTPTCRVHCARSDRRRHPTGD
jgi:hypothetical protein